MSVSFVSCEVGSITALHDLAPNFHVSVYKSSTYFLWGKIIPFLSFDGVKVIGSCMKGDVFLAWNKPAEIGGLGRTG